MELITFENVTLGYDGKPVIEHLNFSVNSGDYICVLGQNGSGKSTMMKALLGFLSPMSGKIICSKELKKNAIGYLPQQEMSQFDFPASVKEVVLSGCQGRHKFPFYNQEDKNLVKKNMEKMGISNLSNKSFRELSGGQKQRVLLARSLCAAEHLILLDEPAAGLDPCVTEDLYRIVKTLNEKEKMTVIMISHDIDHALSESTHILHLGRTMLYYGETKDYDRQKILEEERSCL